MQMSLSKTQRKSWQYITQFYGSGLTANSLNTSLDLLNLTSTQFTI